MVISSEAKESEMIDYFGYSVTVDGKIYNRYDKQLKAHDNGRGYLIVGLRIEGKTKTKAVHRVVAEAYIPNPRNLSDVDHIDCDRQNNHVSNLRWLTHGENIQHSYNTGFRDVSGVKNANAKLTEYDVHEVCNLIVEGLSCRQIADSLDRPYAAVRGIRRRKNWKHISDNYHW